MSLKIAEINGYKNNISFKADEKEKEKTKASVPQETDEEESFWERNKKTILALTVIGAAGIAFAVRKKFSAKNVKLDGENVSKGEKKTMEAFLEELHKFKKSGENSSEKIKEFFSKELSSRTKLNAAESILRKEANIVNESNWEAIFDGILSIKPTDKVKGGNILSKSNLLIERMIDNGLLTTPVIDKILEKISKRPDITKLNTLSSLVETIWTSTTPKEARFNVEQTKKIIDMLDNVSSDKFKKYGMFDESASVSEIKSEYIKKLFSNESVSEDYVTAIKEILAKAKIQDSEKLTIIHRVYYDKFALNSNVSDKNSLNAINEMLSVLIKTDAKGAGKYGENKVETGYNLLKLLQKNDSSHVIIPMEEKLEKAQALKDLLAYEKPKYGDLSSSEAFNGIREITINLKELLFKQNVHKMNIDEIDKFADDIMKDYDDAINRFAYSNFKYSDDKNISLLKRNFQSIKNTIESQFKFHQNESEKANKLKEKLEKFVKDNNINSNGSNNSHDYGHYEGNSSYSGLLRQDAVETAKKTLLDECYKDEKLKEYIDYLDGKKALNRDIVKKIKRAVLLKYHPDKVADEAEKAKRQVIYQKFNEAIMALEKRYA